MREKENSCMLRAPSQVNYSTIHQSSIHRPLSSRQTHLDFTSSDPLFVSSDTGWFCFCWFWSSPFVASASEPFSIEVAGADADADAGAGADAGADSGVAAGAVMVLNLVLVLVLMICTGSVILM